MKFTLILVLSLFSSYLICQTDITDKLWRLEYAKINGQEVYYSQDEMSSPNILFYDQKIRGNSGCNAYHSSYEIGQDGYLRVGTLISTKMGCTKALKLKESDYIAALESPHSIDYQRDIQILILKNAKGDILRFFLQGEKKK